MTLEEEIEAILKKQSPVIKAYNEAKQLRPDEIELDGLMKLAFLTADEDRKRKLLGMIGQVVIRRRAEALISPSNLLREMVEWISK